MKQKSALIFANGEIESLEAARSVMEEGDFLIAADGGLRHLLALGLTPHVLVGDLDSVTPEQVETARAAGTRILRYPPEKDDTDLELAIRLALDEDCTRIRLVGTLGGRLDHLLGNLFLLLRPDLSAVDLRIDEGGQEIFVITSQATILGRPGDTVSLIPLTADAVGVTTERMYYPLQDETLYIYRTRGISNVMQDSEARVSLRSGCLLCIHLRKNAGARIISPRWKYKEINQT